MDTLDFKQWLALELMQQQTQTPEELDPNLNTAAKKAQIAVQTAVKTGKNPIKAAQDVISKSKIPMNKLGQIMPTTDPLKAPGQM